MRVITTDPADNEIVTKEYYEDFYDNTFDNFVEQKVNYNCIKFIKMNLLNI